MASNVSRFEVLAEAEKRHMTACYRCRAGMTCAGRTALQDQQRMVWRNMTEAERNQADP